MEKCLILNQICKISILGLVAISLNNCGEGTKFNLPKHNIPSATQITVDQAATVPVFNGSSSKSSIYIHNNAGNSVSGINYNVQTNSNDSNNQFSIAKSCSTIASHSSCSLQFTTPKLVAPNVQGSALITVSYLADGKKQSFKQIINYALVKTHDNELIYANTDTTIHNHGNTNGYAVIYLYSTKADYQLQNIKINNPNLINTQQSDTNFYLKKLSQLKFPIPQVEPIKLVNLKLII